MVIEDKITGTMKFIEEQLIALRQIRFNGTFTVRPGLKNGGISLLQKIYTTNFAKDVENLLHSLIITFAKNASTAMQKNKTGQHRMERENEK